MKDLISLAASFFKVGLFTFGGGMAMVPFIIEELEKHGWMTSDMFFDFLSMAQMTPGAIAMNSATYVGCDVAGVAGGFVATLFLAMPSVIIMLILSSFMRKVKESKLKDALMNGFKPVTISLIVYAGWQIAEKTLFIPKSYYPDWKVVAVCIACVIILFTIKKVHPILLIVLSGVVGVLVF